MAKEVLANIGTETYYSCCGKSICKGCIDSFRKSGNIGTCPFCNAMTGGKSNEENFEALMKRVEANDAASMCVLADQYYHGDLGLLQDREKAMELWTQAADLASSKAHFHLGMYHHEGGDSKKSKFHYEAAAMAGNEVARCNLGTMEAQSGNMGRAVKHWVIAATAGHHQAMHNLLVDFNQGSTSRESIDSTLIAYNTSCAEMRSDARDAAIHEFIASIGAR
jgi:TPR repeat protein